MLAAISAPIVMRWSTISCTPITTIAREATSCSAPEALAAMLARLLARKLVQADCSTRACQRFSISASSPSALMVAALATVSVERRALGGQRLEILVGQPSLRAMGGQRHADQHRNGERGDGAQRRADREGGGQEERHEGDVDGQHRHLAGEEAAQHVELAQPFGDDARGRALEMAVGKLHQVMQHLARSSACRGARRCAPTASRARRAARSRAHRRPACPRSSMVMSDAASGRRIAPDHRVEHQHHEERRGEAEEVDDERRRRRASGRPAARAPTAARTIAWRRSSGSVSRMHQRARAQRHHLVGRQVPDATLDDIEHGPLAAAARHHDMGGLSGAPSRTNGIGSSSSRRRDARSTASVSSPSRVAGRQEGGLVEA